MKNSLKIWVRKIRGNEKGIAALMFVVLAIVVIGTLAFGFLAETEQKQSGSAMTYASTVAFLEAEAGLRYAEECLLLADASCPCASWTTGCTDWNSPNPVNFPSPISLGGSGRTFEIQVTTTGNANTLTVTSLGKYAGAIRSMSQTIAKQCLLAENAVSTCTPISSTNNSSIVPASATTSSGNCNTPAVPALPTFPNAADAAACPQGSYINGPISGTTAMNGPDEYICNWNQVEPTVTLGTAGTDTTLWVGGNFNLTGNSDLVILGNVKIYVTGTTLIDDNASIVVGNATYPTATLTFQSQGNFTMRNNAKMNPGPLPVVDNQPGDPDRMFVMVGGSAAVSDTGTLENNITFHGGLYGDALAVALENNADFVGSIVAASVSLSNNATITYDAGAGTESGSYSVCGGGSGTSSVPTEG